MCPKAPLQEEASVRRECLRWSARAEPGEADKVGCSEGPEAAAALRIYPATGKLTRVFQQEGGDMISFHSENVTVSAVRRADWRGPAITVRK